MKRLVAFLTLFVFAVAGFTACTKAYSYENPLLGISGTGTLKDTTGNCLPITVYGTFYNGVAPGDTNYVQIEVNVATAGAYNIKTDVQDGFQFADSGFFKTTGLNTITLKTIGTPILNVPTTFTVSFDSTACMFSVNVQDSTGRNAGGGGGSSVNSSDSAWEFTGAGVFYHGPISDAGLQDTLGVGVLDILGENNDSLFNIVITLPTTSIATGTYSTTNAVYFAYYDSASNVIFQATPGTAGAAVTVIITSYNAATNLLTGTFSGTALTMMGIPVTITGGQFMATID
jgi:hypothetical protein